mmetsp:Transcript_21962/g.43630  ORF Transcript_21962/g.43630 Transcript_21962/m.43630 type:complete len:856 (+) Transcript_21962:27-2594(+)|eukprot:CAMPEP_0175138364 /NCGR_PEP_ID=MMETSP0087-20121206/10307_1 /TAXON_ID=136419 /ORGANISM="Unknown Unknown, Strain D1" /LENGTH=855 /DNA_ID=CAMNT_0016421257 /DNA_START=26 /DNA_END=2593 /DNA_ORIENTATION=-
MENRKKKRLSLGAALINKKRLSTVAQNDDTNERKAIDEHLRTSRVSGKTPRKSLLVPRQPFAPIENGVNSVDTSGNSGVTTKNKHRPFTLAGLAPPKLKDDQLSDLYSQCIKLATTNKINQQNSWGLHLIDYMEDVMMQNEEAKTSQQEVDTSFRQKNKGANQRMMNFQKASCVLDSSVMIYSYRVDSVHKDTYKVLGSFSRGQDEEDGTEAEIGEDGEPVKKKTVRRTFNNTLETNLSNINVKSHELQAKTDPLFQKTSASFDQGGARGLLLNNLNVYSGCSIAFDSEIVPDGNDDLGDIDPETEDPALKNKLARKQALETRNRKIASQVSTHLDLSELTALFQAGCAKASGRKNSTLQDLQLCPVLAEFYAAIDNRDSGSTGHDAHDQNSESEEDSDVDCRDQSDGSSSEDLPSTQDMEDFEGANFDETMLDMAIEQEEKLFQEMKHSDNLNCSPPKNNAPVAFPVALAACTGAPLPLSSKRHLDEEGEFVEAEMGTDMPLIFSDQREEFAYVDKSLLKNWAGANHWKFKAPTRASTEKNGSGDGVSKPAKAPFTINFSGEEVPASELAAPSKGKKENLLAKSTVNKGDKTKYVLPHDYGYRMSNLHQLFTKPNMFVRFQKLTKRHLENSKVVGVTGASPKEKEGGLQMSYKEIDTLQPLDDEAFAEGEGFADVGESSDEEDNDSTGFQFHGFDDPQEEEGQDHSSALDLVAVPDKVEKIDIKFARFAKKVNVRQLKDTLWDKLNDESTIDNTSTHTNKKEQDKAKEVQVEGKENESEETHSFQQALTALPQKQSVAFCFICLLHLCNEKGLRLEKKPLDSEGSPEQVPENKGKPYRDDVDHNLSDFMIHLPK